MSLLDYWETHRDSQRGCVKRRKSDKDGSYHDPSPDKSDNGSGQSSGCDSPANDDFLGRDGTPAGAGIAGFQSDEFSAEKNTDTPVPNSQTELEISLPPVQTDQDAIEEYEASRAGERNEEEPDLRERLEKGKWRKGQNSIYVDAFNLALETVLDEESHLFDEVEMEVFRQWKNLSYESQYLYDSTAAVSFICRLGRLSKRFNVYGRADFNRYVRLFLRKTSAWHRINRLGYYSDITDMACVVADLRLSRSLPVATKSVNDNPADDDTPEEATLEGSFRFAESSEEITTLEEASSLLLLDELKVLAKEAKVQGKSKKELLAALRQSSQTQSSFEWNNKHSGDASPASNRDQYYIAKILDSTGDCIRLAAGPRVLFERVHLVFYRSTEWTEKSLTTIILAKISRKNFPRYIVCRSSSIFPSKEALREFESALRTQFRVDNLLESGGAPTADTLQQVKELSEKIYPRWRKLLEEEQQKEFHLYKSGEGAYLRRFSPAWVYTRIVHKGLYPLGRFKEHKREHELLTELLEQRLFHAARRGAWYQRKALLEEHYMWALTPPEGRSEDAQKKHWKRISLRTCEQGLEDPECHLIYHYDLQKRITKLERALRVVKREQHDFGYVTLTQPFERTVEGIRIEREESPVRAGSKNNANSNNPSSKKGRATVWIDEREGDSECRVESMCLSWYRDHGWKGYHAEGGIVRTLFGYLFYDIIFAFVPNVFQTPFQTCPLDLHTDAFYPARASEINHRLVEITNGQAEALIRDVHGREAAKETCAIGIDWSFGLDDLIEIVRCFRGEALATICKVMAQEYQQRGGGIPDLFLWNLEKKEVMFVEVKSENDRLSDTQRLWIHVLMGAGIRVELCNAVAREVRRA